MESEKSWLEIAASRLHDNYLTLGEVARQGDTRVPVLAVIKAGAYGHGADLCAPVLAAAGARWLGVTDAAEGVLVRRSLKAAGVPHQTQPDILVMCGLLPEDAEMMVRNQLTPVVWFPEQIDWLQQACDPRRSVRIHLEIDTGMSRQGVAPGAALNRVLDRLSRAADVRLGGVMTHFASAEVAGSPRTSLQRDRFEEALLQLAARELDPEWMHVGNTSTIDEASSMPWLVEVAARLRAKPMVRSGIGLYGYRLPLEGGDSLLEGRLRPVLAWKSRVIAVTDVAPGAAIGYNATFVVEAPMRLALVPVGYEEGLRRELSATNAQAGGWVMLHGQRAPIVGRVSMNLTTVDVSAISGTGVGDEVTLLGEGVSADDHARLAHTIAYEILCGLRAPPRLVG